MSFNYTKFLKEGGIEKNLQEAGDFGNDPQDRYNYARKFTADLPDTARTEQMIQNLEDALEDYKMTDEVGEFDQAFVEIMIALGKENELMEGDSLINPEAEEIDAEDLDASADYFDSLAENDDILDEIVAEGKFKAGDMVRLKNDDGVGSEFAVIDTRRMFGSNIKAVRVTDKNGKTAEYDETQLVHTFVSELEGEAQNEEKEEK